MGQTPGRKRAWSGAVRQDKGKITWSGGRRKVVIAAATDRQIEHLVYEDDGLTEEEIRIAEEEAQ